MCCSPLQGLAILHHMTAPRQPQTHNYTLRYWGHDYTFDPIDGGQRAHMMGWGRGIQAGDYLIIQNGQDTTRYQIDSIEYYSDPPDMWSAQAIFAPRPLHEAPT